MTSDLSLRFISAGTVHTSLWLHTFTSQPCWMFRLMHCSYRTQCCVLLFFFTLFIRESLLFFLFLFGFLFLREWVSWWFQAAWPFALRVKYWHSTSSLEKSHKCDAQASTCTVKTPLNRAFPRWTPVLPVIREGWWDDLHCNLPLLTSVNSNCQLVKEPQKVRQLSSGTSIHCEFQQEGGTQRDEEKDEHCLFFFFQERVEIYFFSTPPFPLCHWMNLWFR